VTAAAIGAIIGSVVVLGSRTLLDGEGDPQSAKIVLALATVAILASGRRIPEPLIVVAAALIGLAIY
jgi:chromate transporter